ncbi:MAG: hypothetical protein IJX19_07670 [Clostridia bacterium]|nr:hypothetical protein [Clostridia bacterium]
MTRKEFLKKYIVRFSAALLLVGLIVYTVYHIRGASASDLMTVPAREITDLRMVSGEAYLFRDESLLFVEGTGVVNDLAESGSKVSKNEALSQVWLGYSPFEQELAQSEVDRLDRVIRVLEDSRVSGGEGLSQAEQYRQEAGKLYLSLQQALHGGQWKELPATSDEMLALLNRFGILTGKTEDLDQKLAELKQEKSDLLKGSCVTLRNQESSGFFFDRSCVDGYETLYTVERLRNLTPESLDELKELSPKISENTTTVGKMVYGYTWYIAVELSGDASLFSVGDRYDVGFSEDGERRLSMTCEAVTAGEDGRFLVTFSSGDHPSGFSYERIRRVEITVGSTTGYYIPESALVRQDGVDGVYIFKDSTVYFRKIEIIYRGEGYCIAAARGDRGEDYLDLYDILVTAGKNLYDGKVY